MTCFLRATPEPVGCSSSMTTPSTAPSLKTSSPPFIPSTRLRTATRVWKKILARPERFCAVLLDVVMPRMSGLAVLERLKAESLTERLPVFLITAEASDENNAPRLRYGRDGRHQQARGALHRPEAGAERHRAVSGEKAPAPHRRQPAEQTSRAGGEDHPSQSGHDRALSTAIEFPQRGIGRSRPPHPRHHPASCLPSTELGDGLDGETIEQIALASIMHDVGKIAIPDAILTSPAN